MNIQEKSRLILEAIAKGQSYDQILAQNVTWTYRDIFTAAQEALNALNSASPEKTYEERMDAIQREHPRAYAAWQPSEDETLERLHASGKKPKEIAEILHRQPSAIKSRLEKLKFRDSPKSRP